jgi:hypothetical protein
MPKTGAGRDTGIQLVPFSDPQIML